MIVDSSDCEPLGALVLAPLAAAPNCMPARGRVVCACVDVAESEITAALADGAGIDELQAHLKCGTECGSCVPELQRMCAEAGSRIRDSGVGENQIDAEIFASVAESRIQHPES
jgi:assimilatory nitrate reductase catalytic subunit